MKKLAVAFVLASGLSFCSSLASEFSFLDFVCNDDAEIAAMLMYQDVGDAGAFSGLGAQYRLPYSDNFSIDARIGLLSDEASVLMVGTEMIPLELNADWRFPARRFTPYVGGGIGFYNFADFDSEVGFNAHGGFTFELFNGITLFGELRYLIL